MANRSAMKRAKEAHKLTGAALNRERRVGKQELQKYRELGDLYVPPKSVSRSPVRGRRKKIRAESSSSSGSESEDKEEEMPDN
jgi:hypothetical protein